jgi:predicted lipase
VTDVLEGLTSEYSHGRGYSEVFPIANPAVATGFTYTVTGQFWERLVAVSFVLTSDGNAANRNVLLVQKDAMGAVLDASPPAAVQVASKVYTYVYRSNASATNDTVNLVNVQAINRLFLQPQYTVAVTIGSAQAGDQLSAIRIYRERFDTSLQGLAIGMVVETPRQAAAQFVGA